LFDDKTICNELAALPREITEESLKRYHNELLKSEIRDPRTFLYGFIRNELKRANEHGAQQQLQQAQQGSKTAAAPPLPVEIFELVKPKNYLPGFTAASRRVQYMPEYAVNIYLQCKQNGCKCTMFRPSKQASDDDDGEMADENNYTNNNNNSNSAQLSSQCGMCNHSYAFHEVKLFDLRSNAIADEALIYDTAINFTTQHQQQQLLKQKFDFSANPLFDCLRKEKTCIIEEIAAKNNMKNHFFGGTSGSGSSSTSMAGAATEYDLLVSKYDINYDKCEEWLTQDTYSISQSVKYELENKLQRPCMPMEYCPEVLVPLLNENLKFYQRILIEV